MTALLFSEVTGGLIGAFYDVYRELRGGLLEAPYRNAMLVALRKRGIAAVAEQPVDVWYGDEIVGSYRMDIVVADRIVVECKAARQIDAAHEAQLLNYLHATRMPLGFLLNFGDTPSFRRMIYDRNNPKRSTIDKNW